MRTVLIVEDDEASRLLMKRRLERIGYRTILARDGSEAVAKAVDHRPDVIVMDLSMPETDGIEAWRILCEMMDAPPPAIVLTGVMLADVRLTCAELGFRAYLSKPVDFDALVAALQRIAPLPARAPAP